MENTHAVAMAERIARAAAPLGGTVYYVGGCVRDELLGRPTKDVDVEVHGLAPEVLERLLDGLGTRLTIGESFGIYTLAGCGLDIALPRREHCTGQSHRDFAVSVDPFAGTLAAARRRDFTVNAMMKNVQTGKLIDPFGGRRDLESGILRHVKSDTFSEDALRVLRAAQFAARFSFTVAEETKALCRAMTLSHLSRERVFMELCKALLGAEHPSVFFDFLREVGHLSHWFPELESLIGVPQAPRYHAEGDVWNHTMLTLDAAAALRSRTVRPRDFMLSALLHDVGKALTTECTDGVYHAYRHEAVSDAPVTAFLRRLTDEDKLLGYCLSMVRLHMRPGMAHTAASHVKATNALFDASPEGEDLICLCLADVRGCRPMRDDRELEAFLHERLSIYQRTMARPYVTGRDLIDAGLTPGESFHELLAYAHKLRLSGLDKKSQLSQTLAYYRTMKKP